MVEDGSVLRVGSAPEGGSALVLRVGSALDESEGEAGSGNLIAVSSPPSPILCPGNRMLCSECAIFGEVH